MSRQHRLLSYFSALLHLWHKTKGKLCTVKQMEERFAICSTCEHFQKKRCQLCGCGCTDRKSFFNKLAFPTERCPDDPPRWLETELGADE
jgi:hypothetical protein